jgi:hypothetical protein
MERFLFGCRQNGIERLYAPEYHEWSPSRRLFAPPPIDERREPNPKTGPRNPLRVDRHSESRPNPIGILTKVGIH